MSVVSDVDSAQQRICTFTLQIVSINAHMSVGKKVDFIKPRDGPYKRAEVNYQDTPLHLL